MIVMFEGISVVRNACALEKIVYNILYIIYSS